MKGKIAEIFESIQGEGIYVGQRQIFVRFFGCNLKYCKFCDTKLSYFEEYDPQELFQQIRTYQDNYHSISFTGGEPLLQKDFLKEILKLTRQNGFKHYLETNGTLPDALEEVINYIDIIAMDLKLPSSTGLDNFWQRHAKFLEIASKKEVFIKAVICKSTEEKDLHDALDLIKKINSSLVFVLQPNFYEDDKYLQEKLDRFKYTCIKNNVTTYIMPQMHKVMGAK